MQFRSKCNALFQKLKNHLHLYLFSTSFLSLFFISPHFFFISFHSSISNNSLLFPLLLSSSSSSSSFPFSLTPLHLFFSLSSNTFTHHIFLCFSFQLLLTSSLSPLLLFSDHTSRILIDFRCFFSVQSI
jgi:hypothetical protein